MLRDIYAIPNAEARYKSDVLEVNNELDEIIMQIDCLLFTRKGEVLIFYQIANCTNILSFLDGDKWELAPGLVQLKFRWE